MATTALLSELLTLHGMSVDRSDPRAWKVGSVDLLREHRALRTDCGLSVQFGVLPLRVKGSGALDLLDWAVQGDLGLLREERALHSVMVDEEGHLLTEVYVACLAEEDYLVLLEGGDREAAVRILKSRAPAPASWAASHAVLGFDGPYAFRTIEKLFQADVLGISFLGCVPVDRGYLLRAGKIGEYGYLAVLETERALEIVGTACERGLSVLIGDPAISLARLENRALDLEAVARFSGNPYELGLFWMLHDSPHKLGRRALDEARLKIDRRLVGFRALGQSPPPDGTAVLFAGERVGVVVCSDRSPLPEGCIGFALVDAAWACVGLEVMAAGEKLRFVSTPFIVNQSLKTPIE